ncbi:MAG TPA: hypothetical protein VK901_00755 [Nitrospiraceae bacterium]|nr:hypothetical protein [Nitrospiraceae bacterium]
MLEGIIEVLIVGLLTGLVGIIWIIVRDCFDDDHSPNDSRQESASPDHHDGEEPYALSSRQPKADVGVLAVHREG